MDSSTKNRIMNLLVEDPSMITLLKSKFVDDDIWIFCIEQEPSLFKKVKNPSQEVINAALEADGTNIKVLQKKFPKIKITKQMAYKAIRSTPGVIKSIPIGVIDESLKETAFDLDPTLIREYAYVRPDYLNSRVKENPSFIKYIPVPSEDMVCEAIRRDPNVIVYFNTLSEKMEKALEEYHSQMYQFYVKRKEALGKISV